MRTGMGWMFRELCRWELGVRLGWLPMTRGHLDWITWSLEVVGGACGAPDRGGISNKGSNK
jgi:hypothetical protein